MKKDLERLTKIFDKTDGNCHLCHKELIFENHGLQDVEYSWHIEHSKPKASGGTDHLNNLYPACAKCNLEKGTLKTSVIRKRKGVIRAPLAKTKKAEIKRINTIDGAVLGGILGILGGPIAMLSFSIIGGIVGNKITLEK